MNNQLTKLNHQLEQLNILQVEVMNISQSMEQQHRKQNEIHTIPGEPLDMDNDPKPGPPLA